MKDNAVDRVARHLDLDDRSLAVLKATGLSQQEMLAVGYLAKVSGRTMTNLVGMRRELGSWSEVSKRLGYPMDFPDGNGSGE